MENRRTISFGEQRVPFQGSNEVGNMTEGCEGIKLVINAQYFVSDALHSTLYKLLVRDRIRLPFFVRHGVDVYVICLG